MKFNRNTAVYSSRITSEKKHGFYGRQFRCQNFAYQCAKIVEREKFNFTMGTINCRRPLKKPSLTLPNPFESFQNLHCLQPVIKNKHLLMKFKKLNKVDNNKL